MADPKGRHLPLKVIHQSNLKQDRQTRREREKVIMCLFGDANTVRLKILNLFEKTADLRSVDVDGGRASWKV